MKQLIHLSKLLLLYFMPTDTFAAPAIKNKSKGESCTQFPMLTLFGDVSFNYLFHLIYCELQGNYFTAILNPKHKPSSFRIIYKQASP